MSREKCVVLFGRNSMKVSVSFDMKSKKEFAIAGSNSHSESVNTYLFFWPNGFLLYALGFHACMF